MHLKNKAFFFFLFKEADFSYKHMKHSYKQKKEKEDSKYVDSKLDNSKLFSNFRFKTLDHNLFPLILIRALKYNFLADFYRK